MLHAFLRFGAAQGKAPSAKLSEAVSLAVSLMQHGLDTHALVEGKGEAIKRQMMVLAGDYFSSRFYQLLSQVGNIQAIGIVSQAVSEVNRIKMNLYSRAKKLMLTAEEYIRDTVEINTHLFVSFTSWMDAMYRKSCPAIFRTFAECELLATELTRTSPQRVKNSWAYWFILEHGTPEEIDVMVSETIDESRLQSILLKYNIIGRLTDQWETKAAELHQLLRDMNSDKLAEELIRLTEPIFAGCKAIEAQEI